MTLSWNCVLSLTDVGLRQGVRREERVVYAGRRILHHILSNTRWGEEERFQTRRTPTTIFGISYLGTEWSSREGVLGGLALTVLGWRKVQFLI